MVTINSEVSRQLTQQDKKPLAVSLNKLVFSWPAQSSPTLKISHLDLKASEHLFLSGPSGSGKSTLLGLVAGILRPTSGSVYVNGVSLGDLSGSERDAFRGAQLGVIFQQLNLVPYLSVVENVLLPCRFSSLRAIKAAKQYGSTLEAAASLLTRLDIAKDIWNRRASQLSVGQQQRVAAARALIGQPSLVIADEPTSALDANRQEAFLHLLLRECRVSGSALLFVSHNQQLKIEFNRVIELESINEAVTNDTPFLSA